MKFASIKLSELRSSLDLRASTYIESDRDRIARELREKHPDKVVRVSRHGQGYRATLVETLLLDHEGRPVTR